MGKICGDGALGKVLVEIQKNQGETPAKNRDAHLGSRPGLVKIKTNEQFRMLEVVGLSIQVIFALSIATWFSRDDYLTKTSPFLGCICSM